MEGIRSSLRKHPFLLRSSPLKVASHAGVFRGARREEIRAPLKTPAWEASKKIFWDHFSKSLVTIQVFTSGTWAPIGLKNGGN